jgi:hypothetical protein
MKTLFSNRLSSESTEQQPENAIANVMNSRQDCPYQVWPYVIFMPIREKSIGVVAIAIKKHLCKGQILKILEY